MREQRKPLLSRFVQASIVQEGKQEKFLEESSALKASR